MDSTQELENLRGMVRTLTAERDIAQGKITDICSQINEAESWLRTHPGVCVATFSALNDGSFTILINTMIRENETIQVAGFGPDVITALRDALAKKEDRNGAPPPVDVPGKEATVEAKDKSI